MISVSYLSVIDDLENVVERLNNTNCDYIHVDVMDGVFVPNKTPDINIIKDVLIASNKKLDVHLMVKDIKFYVDKYSELKPEIITIHYEASDNIMDDIKYIKSKGIKCGVSIKPNTSVSSLLPYLIDIDLILVMSVEPGFGGQTFLDSAIPKINHLRNLRKQNDLNYLIEVDGGINDINASMCNADILVSGNYITSSDDYQKRIDKLRN